MKLWLARQAENYPELPGYDPRRDPSGLTVHGERQATALGHHLARQLGNDALTCVVSSPQSPAYHTAAYMAGPLHMPVRSILLSPFFDEQGPSESARNVDYRAIDGVRYIEKLGTAKSILVVSGPHLLHAMQQVLDGRRHHADIPPCGITSLVI